MEWQPIETAPKVEFDELLLYDLDIGTCLGYWSEEVGDWMVHDAIGEYGGDVTHWMPLPDPPQ